MNTCGAGVALEMLLTAEPIDAERALLDDQLRIEALNAYSCADPDETLGLLGRFYDKTDAGRAGARETPL